MLLQLAKHAKHDKTAKLLGNVFAIEKPDSLSTLAETESTFDYGSISSTEVAQEDI